MLASLSSLWRSTTLEQVPVYYLTATFDRSTFTHRPGITKEKDLEQKYLKSVPYAHNITALILLENGHFRDDPVPCSSRRIFVDDTDYGIPHMGELRKVPVTRIDEESPLTVHIKYFIDLSDTAFEVGNSFTTSMSSPGSEIELTLKGRKLVQIHPEFSLKRPSYTDCTHYPRLNNSQDLSDSLTNSVKSTCIIS